MTTVDHLIARLDAIIEQSEELKQETYTEIRDGIPADQHLGYEAELAGYVEQIQSAANRAYLLVRDVEHEAGKLAVRPLTSAADGLFMIRADRGEW